MVSFNPLRSTFLRKLKINQVAFPKVCFGKH